MAEILLVEDNPGDVLLARTAFESSKVQNQLHVVTDGEEALDFLNQRGKYVDAPEPHLVLLDINLPRVGGFEVLEAVKQSTDLCHIPIVMLTSSDQTRDVNGSYKAHANSYITKPPTIARLREAIARLEEFWFETVALPK